ncbi:MAG TPA: hypothetical protein VIM07_10925 [Chitinophagaceae bacterium]
MDHYQSNPKKKNRKPIYLLLAFLGVFIVFIYFITRPSVESIAIKELQTSYNTEDVKQCWYKYKADLSQDAEFISETRNKLASLNISDKDLQNCMVWLPPAPESINLIVVPDFSMRIIDTVNNPDQIKNDTTLLNSIWRAFVSQARLKMNSKDRLVLDVTDEGQAGGTFRTIANDLIFDLSEHHNQSNRLYFDKVGNRFNENVSKLYNLASKQPIGADYHYYFEERLPKLIQKSTLKDNYRNVLIIITDGYLESQNAQRTGIWAYTGTFTERTTISNQLRNGKSYNEALNNLKAIPDCQSHFPELEVLIVEVNPRKSLSTQEKSDPGTVNDFPILKSQWTNWFKLLEIKNANSEFFIRRNDATQITEKQIDKFLKK